MLTVVESSVIAYAAVGVTTGLIGNKMPMPRPQADERAKPGMPDMQSLPVIAETTPTSAG
ncbi:MULTISPECIES: hypothetical protein [unclassified Azospirillum]|uniref:hypothetical protein n=1 Tax=unclassified Azospirillum TaxID=2630922 RepID=UPI0011775C98|nr:MULTISPECIES: hypothetical protein [unclassified Azospirillum]